MKEEQLTKSILAESAVTFKNDILQNSYRIEFLKELASKNKLYTKRELRPIAWQIFLKILPSESKINNNNIIKEWIDIIYIKRKEYKEKIQKYCSLKKLGLNDPLLTNEENTNLLYNEEERNVLNLIDLDLQRTHQALDLFKTNKTKNILANVLFIYAKENWGEIPYGQGMNELLSMIYICIYPYYFNYNENKKEKVTKEELYEYLDDIDKYYKEIYLYFHDEDEIQSDLYYLFEALEKKGINDLYQIYNIKKDDPNYHLYELFPDIVKDHSDEDKINHLNLRSYTIFKEKLKLIDKKLFNHLKRINVKCNYFMHRWLKCIFAREFDRNDTLSLWDKIFFYEFNSTNIYKYPLVYIDFICVAMFVKIRYELFNKDEEGDCYTIIFHYPRDDNISHILEISDKVAEIIEQKLNGEIYDINEVLRLVKRPDNFNENDNINNIEASEELIIKPHMYNQRNNSSLIFCAQNKEIIIVCGKIHIRTKTLMYSFLFLIMIILLIWIYNTFMKHSQ